MKLIKLIGVKSICQTIHEYGLEADPEFMAHCPKPANSAKPKALSSNTVVSDLTLNLSFPGYKKEKNQTIIKSGNLLQHGGYTAVQVKNGSYLTFYPCSSFKGSGIDLFYRFMELRSSKNSSWGTTDLIVPVLEWDKTKRIDVRLSKKGKDLRFGQHIDFKLDSDRTRTSGNKATPLMPCIFGFYDTLNGGLPVVVGRIK